MSVLGLLSTSKCLDILPSNDLHILYIHSLCVYLLKTIAKEEIVDYSNNCSGAHHDNTNYQTMFSLKEKSFSE